MLELLARDGLARICRYHTAHGIIRTPTLMPVVNPNQLLFSAQEMKKRFGAEIVITNAYIISKSQHLREAALRFGIHELLAFDGPVMTDSGTFQQHVYGEVNVSNTEIVEFQREIKPDIGTILDVFSEPDEPYEKVVHELEETVRRAKAATELKGSMRLATTVHGSTYLELRERSAQQVAGLGDFFPIGGIVPLLESYRFREIVEIVLSCKKMLPPEKPVHLFGCGHPMLFPLVVMLGVDFFDSASYAKYARENRLLFPDGTRHLSELEENFCLCPACSKYTLKELKSLPEPERQKTLAAHNLYISFAELRRIQDAIHHRILRDLVEARAHSHPALFEALKVLKKYNPFLEKFESLSGKRLFYLGPETSHRPSAYRYRKRIIERYELPKTDILICFQENGRRPFFTCFENVIRKVLAITNTHFVVNSALGPVPIELDEMYPAGHVVLPEKLALETYNDMNEWMKEFSHCHSHPLGIIWEGEATLNYLRMLITKPNLEFNLDLLRVKAVADMQFGRGAGAQLLSGTIQVVKSKTTGKIRNVYRDGEHILSLRAEDGLFTLKPAGAKLLHSFFAMPKLRVVVSDESVKFNRAGRNVFCKFVLDADPELRPMDEVLIVDKDDVLVGVGRALLNSEEMKRFKIGIAVKVREGIAV